MAALCVDIPRVDGALLELEVAETMGVKRQEVRQVVFCFEYGLHVRLSSHPILSPDLHFRRAALVKPRTIFSRL